MLSVPDDLGKHLRDIAFANRDGVVGGSQGLHKTLLKATFIELRVAETELERVQFHVREGCDYGSGDSRIETA